MAIPDEKLGEILRKQNFLEDEELEKAVSQKGQNIPLRDYLIGQELITKDLLGQALAAEYDVSYFDLNSNPAEEDLVKKLSKDMAENYMAVPVEADENTVQIATSDPSQEGIKQELRDVFPDKEIKLAFSLEEDIKDLFVYYRASLDTRFSEIIEESETVAPDILDEILDDAFTFEASDIHFEPRVDKIVVRFRVDGVLQNAGEIPKEFYDNILNRIKVMSNLRIDEHFIAQDGSLQYTVDEKSFDVRTSIVPTVHGEKVVLRILASYIGGLRLSNLGLTDEKQQLLTEAAQQPFGMILVTGPTGSGKTTTLYSLLRIVDTPEVNITTIEDPVEYKLSSANQIQVDEDNDLSFSEGLRSIVRQDPDVILVGEIRDEETAEISVNAALTGHLLLSTFHSNDAATAVPRLLDMGTEPFLLASTLELVMAQRLVRTICEECRHSVEKEVSELDEIAPGSSEFVDKNKDESVTMYEGRGCKVCNQTGYNGRTAVFELIRITDEMEELIITKPATQEIWEQAQEQGAESMFADGMEKVKQGITTLEELQRVTPTDNVEKS